jgi:hypothetical protein
MPRKIWLFTALVVTLPLAVGAQTVTTMKNEVTGTATIEAIDQTARTLTLKNSAGEVDVVQVGPDVKRFNELKVGDTIKARYYESVVYQLQKPGAAPAGTPTDKTAATPGAGATPGATVARQVSTSVTVTGIDPKVPSITVRTPQGHIVTRRVQDPKNLANVAVGDRIDITYTMALVMNVEPTAPAATKKPNE